MRLIELIKKQFQDIKVGGIRILKSKVEYLFLVARNKAIKTTGEFYRLVFFLVDWPRKRFLTKFYVEDFVDFLGKKQSRFQPQADRSIVVFVIAYSKHLYLFDKCLMRSLFFHDNIPSLLLQGRGIKFRVFTRPGDRPGLQSTFERYYQSFLNSISEAQVHAKLSIEIDEVQHGEDIFKVSMLRTIAECLKTKSTMLMGMPDFFYGNGSVQNLIKLDDAGTCCVAAAHLRVNDEDFLRAVDDIHCDISNPQLVRLALKFPHQNTKVSFEGDGNASYLTGVKLSQLETGGYIMTHRLPNIWVANFTQNDLDYFIRNPFQAWDHQWPTQLIVEGRYKVLGSTDLTFVAEMTEVDSHLCEISQSEPIKNPTSYLEDRYLHKKINQIFVVSMSASEH